MPRFICVVLCVIATCTPSSAWLNPTKSPNLSAPIFGTHDWIQAALTIALTEPQLPALHPDMADVFRQKAATLAAGLEHHDQRDAAREALRGFVDKIVIPSGDGLLQVVGNLGAMLEAAAGQKVRGRQTVGNAGCGGALPSWATCVLVSAA